MYNEDEKELQNTLRGVITNYNFLKLDRFTKFSRDDFLVFVVCDGYEKIPESLKKLARQKKFLDESILVEKGFMTKDAEGNFKMKSIDDCVDADVRGKAPANLLHCFMVTTWDFGLGEEVLKGHRINFIFGIKQRNDGKINSHRWFFQGICSFIRPKYCVVLDIGTRPDTHSIQKLIGHMDIDENSGGCCGEIEVDIESIPKASFVQLAQFYEYKLGHTPDKACESFFGFTSVLPGAWSIFRWKAIRGAPLDMFFKSTNSNYMPTCAQANEYLAEDRIMCL